MSKGHDSNSGLAGSELRKQGSGSGATAGRWIAVAVAVGLSSVGCEPVERNYVPADRESEALEPGASGSGSGMTANMGPNGGAGASARQIDDADISSDLGTGEGQLGEECSTDTDCGTPGGCAQGVCCDSACTDLCTSCALPGSAGVCSAAPSDERCGALSCQGLQSQCAGFGVSQLGLNCEAPGTCRTALDCEPIVASLGDACSEGTGECDGAGACIVAGKASLGEACSEDTDCAEAHCITADGVGEDGATGGVGMCCNAACDGACQQCSASGRCDEVPVQDELCPAIECPADNFCRDYQESLDAGQCTSFDRCQQATDCKFTELRPSSECVCDAEGECGLATGTACEANGDCQSERCRETPLGTQVCCASDCVGGLFCGSDGASCVACQADSIACEGNVEQICNDGSLNERDCVNGCSPGQGCNELPPAGFLCDGGRCEDSVVCQQDEGGEERCCVRDCAAEGKLCSDSGSCVCAPGQQASGSECLLSAGDPCEADEQCQVGSSCTDGVCCQEACDGLCEQCQAGTGVCQAVPAGQTEAQCNNGQQCTGGRGDCQGYRIKDGAKSITYKTGLTD